MNTTVERCEALVVAVYSKGSGTAPTAEERLAGAWRVSFAWGKTSRHI